MDRQIIFLNEIVLILATKQPPLRFHCYSSFISIEETDLQEKYRLYLVICVIIPIL